MRLAHVNYAFDRTLGSEHELLDTYHTLIGWSDAAAGAGLTVDVFQAFHREARVRRGAVNYTFHACGGPGDRTRQAMPRAVAARSPDVVHVNGLDSARHLWQLRRRLAPQVAIVVQDHGGAPRTGLVGAPMQRYQMRAADGFLFTSLDQAAPWIVAGVIRSGAAVYAVPEASTDLVPVDRASARALSGMSGDPALLWVGRLDANKDPLTVLGGFERALDTLPAATLTMVYSGTSLLAEVQRRIAASRSLSRCVRLAGAIDRGVIAAYFSAADLFVLGSASEACGYALLEACACGATPVVTSIAPFRAVTGNGAIGRLWPNGDADACGAALIAADRMRSDAQRQRVLAHFANHLSWPVVGRRAADVYRQVVTARRRRQDAGFARAKLTTSPCRAEQPTSNASSIMERPSSMR